MELHNGLLFWPSTFVKKQHSNPPIRPHYDVIVVGAGMSGILTAKALIDEGLKVAVLERNEIGSGSTAANTGLLQYSNDIQLHELSELIGEEDAVRFYKLCYKAVDQLEEIAHSLLDQADFIRRPSICYASKKGDVKVLEKECEMLIKHGFPAEFWNELVVEKRLPFKAPAALYTNDDAEINPYKFVVSLAEQLIGQGMDLFEHTYANVIENEGNEIILRTMNGDFKASRIVYTTGYERLPYATIKGADINRSYAIVTEQKPSFKGWFEDALIWETARPYLYMRKTVDNRIIIGGLDERKSSPAKHETVVDAMARELIDKLHELLPDETFHAPYKYCASFGESLDHLPFIGQHPEDPNHYYLLGFGGNGTVYSMLGSKIIADLIMNRPNDDARIVTLDRKYGIK
ncbi:MULTISPECIES: NAD(P)/FAD-dependent oxidoreductase [Solibacillus]|uniref:FAD-binding oxidoreductase n=1 Tax=Solibacillus merdavium TaxID=2762218 RepID=A0ABR8XP31_9BACL|nr:FAD-binding oxidoreductase [Solibacillus merdavium]MBD8033702.1 FAD-binding oxidoreductase [Solibacillus merdavium]